MEKHFIGSNIFLVKDLNNKCKFAVKYTLCFNCRNTAVLSFFCYAKLKDSQLFEYMCLKKLEIHGRLVIQTLWKII